MDNSEKVIDLLKELVNETCNYSDSSTTIPGDDGDGNVDIDSNGSRTKAEAIRFLANIGMIKLICDKGNRIGGNWV